MFNNRNLHILVLTFLVLGLTSGSCYAEMTVKAANLPINSANGGVTQATGTTNSNSLVSPSKPQAVNTDVSSQALATKETAPSVAQASTNVAKNKSDFDFDLKLKAKNSSQQTTSAPVNATQSAETAETTPHNDDLPKDIQYKSNPVENLGNSVLSQLDDDLFTQMSEIEKSMTLLTLELKREKIRNEIEAQKAIRQKNADDLERQKSEYRLKELERKKQIEAELLAAKQNLLDKEQLFEIMKQRKLLNAYMNQMLIEQQEWLKEKEALYAHIASLEQEKKDLIKSFKKRIDKVLDASAKNIQVAEAAKANFERVVKNLKARNEQLRKRVEADAKIIKNAKNMYIQSQSIEELKDKNAANRSLAEMNANAMAMAALEAAEASEASASADMEKLSSKYALLGITGRAGSMSIEIIGADGQPISLKIGSSLPTGHVVKEIGSDYAKFARDGLDDYLYIGRTIDGYVPVIGREPTGANAKK
ncbi:MAG: hypothetical protein IKW58_02875 [Alphaproteobacteria bacterium]|nr:hypothetical protein [Alphaproteobacteria bacterium]